MDHSRIHVTINVAMSADGKIDTVARKGAAISSDADRERVDRLRAAADAVMVGGHTLLQEDPRLTVKSPQLRRERKAAGREENPVKVGVVSVAELKLDGDFMTAGPARRIIYTTRRTSPKLVGQLEAAGAQVFLMGSSTVELKRVMDSLAGMGIQDLLVEGGGTLIAEFFRLGLVDELHIYLSARIFGGSTAPTLADGEGFLSEQAPRLRLESVAPFDEQGGILIHYHVQH